MTETRTFNQAAGKALIGAAASQEPSTKDSTTSTTSLRPSEAELERRRAFLQTFRRWEILFKRRNGESEEAEKWLIAEYYDSLKHLSEAGFEVLTRQLKEKCIFFPTIRECLELTKPSGPYDWGHPFLNKPELLAQNLPSQAIRYTPAVEHNQAGDPE